MAEVRTPTPREQARYAMRRMLGPSSGDDLRIVAVQAAVGALGLGPVPERAKVEDEMETAMLDALVYVARRHGWSPPR